MTSNAQPEHETCPHDGHMLDRTGKCWYCGGIYPAGKPALTVVENEPQVEVETVQTMTVDLETGEVQEPAGQMVLGDDPAFVRVPMRKSVPVTKVSFSGTVAIADWELEAYLGDTGQELAPGRVVRLGVTAYMPGPYAAWVKRSEKDEGTRERREWWEHEGRIGLKVVEIGSLQVTDREWSDD